MTPMGETLDRAMFAGRGRRYAFLFLLLVDVFVIPPMVTLGVIPAWAQPLTFSFTAAAAVMALSSHDGVRSLVVGVALISVAARWVPMAGDTWGFHLVEAVGVTAAAATFAALLLLDAFGKGRLPDRMLAVLLVYVLAGFIWAYAYSLVDTFRPGALQMPGSRRMISEYVYFSFCTLTTVGYGDIVPVHPVARVMAVLEAMAGSLYLVIVVARFVGERNTATSRGG